MPLVDSLLYLNVGNSFELQRPPPRLSGVVLPKGAVNVADAYHAPR